MRLAYRMLQKCDLIPPVRIHDLLYVLLELNDELCLSSSANYEFPISFHNLLAISTATTNSLKSSEDIENETVALDQLDRYIELLYDEPEDKIKGAVLILQLASKAEHLPELSRNDTLLCALSRVLREEGKKSLELAIYVVSIFAHFSNYADFQYTISSYKVGSCCLELIYFELMREETWSKELSQKKAQADAQHENLSAKAAYEKLLVSYQNLIKKQNLLFKHALYILLNIAEDLQLELKIVNKGIVGLLAKLLERNSQDLLLVVVVYLKKLSVFSENVTAMKELGIVKALTPLLFLDNELLVYNLLKLVYNLMLDRELRAAFVRSGLMTKLVAYFTKKMYLSVVISMFYLISCEAKYVGFFRAHPQLIGLLLEKVAEGVEYRTIINSLLINLSTCYQLAQLIVDYTEFHAIVKMALAERNVQLLRLVRNISCYSDNSFKLTLATYHQELIRLMIEPSGGSANQSEVLVECAAIQVNLSPLSVDWLAIYRQHSLYEFIVGVLNTERNGKPANVEVFRYFLLLVAATAHQAEVGNFLVEKKIVDTLLNLLNGKVCFNF